jgi:CRP/FNR family transcriptional regulator
MERLTFPTEACGDQCAGCGARGYSLCAALESSELRAYERLAHHVHFAAKETLFRQDEFVGSVFNINEGVARLYKLLPDGRRQIVGFALPGDFLGMSPAERYTFSADAVVPVTACRFPKTAFMRYVETKPHFLRRMNEFANRDLCQAQDQMLLLGRRSAEEKIAAFLVGWRDRMEQHGTQSKTLALPMSRQDIADFLGLTIETVSRTFTRLERDKMLIIVPGGVRLLDSKRVEAMAAA